MSQQVAVTGMSHRSNPLNCPDELPAIGMQERIEAARKAQDSVGGIIECIATGFLRLGEPVFDKLDAKIAQRCSVSGRKGNRIRRWLFLRALVRLAVQYEMALDGNGKPMFLTNHAGGVLGECPAAPHWCPHRRQAHPIDLPSPRTMDLDGRNGSWRFMDAIIRVYVRGRRRIEAMAAITILDAWYIRHSEEYLGHRTSDKGARLSMETDR